MSSTLNRYKSEWITLDDGRQFRGRTPGLSGVTHLEHLLRDQLAVYVRGVTEAKLPYGRADVMSQTDVFEVETAAKWRHGVRQVLAYAAQCGLRPAIALFGETHRDEVLKLFLKVRDSRPRVELWWHDGYGWVYVSSRKHCRNMRETSEGLLGQLRQRKVGGVEIAP